MLILTGLLSAFFSKKRLYGGPSSFPNELRNFILSGLVALQIAQFTYEYVVFCVMTPQRLWI
jgi:hypothetical protein